MYTILIGFAILISAVIFSNIITNKIHLSETSESSPSPSPSSSLISSSSPSPTPIPTPTPILIPIPPTFTPQPKTSSSLNILDFKYPDSTIVSQSSSLLSLESSNTPDDITKWYEDKIKSFGFNVKTFVKTKTNGNVLNKLAGAKNNLGVLVEINKENDQEKVKITVTLD